MYYTTGFTESAFKEFARELFDAFPPLRNTFGKLRVFDSEKGLVMALEYLRTNATQCHIAESHGVSQSLVSKSVNYFAPKIAEVFGGFRANLEDLAKRSAHEPLIVDGTLVTSANHAHDPQLFSGKHRRNGYNIQIVSTLDGELVYVSDPLPGKTHDARAIRESGILEAVGKSNTLADKGYVGLGLITPVKNRGGEKLAEDDEKFNKTINAMRSAVERCIAHFKLWRIFSTRYRRPKNTLKQTIHAITAIEFWKNAL